MASKPKDQVKEKRGTSPSFPRHGDPTQRRRSPSPAAAAPDQKNASASSTSTEKQVPNYLKPTLSSKLDPSSKPNAKKQPSSDKQSTQLTRRKSFDKPPSPSGVSKPHTTSMTASPNSSEKSLRSSSFSSKTSPFPKSNLEKSSKATKDVGKHSSLQQPRPSNVRKSSATNSKKPNNASSGTTTTTLTTKAPRRTSSPITVIDSSKPESQEKDQESSPTEAEEIKDKKLPTENLTLEEDKEHEHVINEEELDEGEELKLCDSSTVTEDHSAPLSVGLEDTQPETTPTEENGNNHQEAEEHSKEEISESHQHQEMTTFVGEVEVDGEKKETGEEMASVNPKENSSEVKEEVVGEISKEALKSEEITQVERVVGKGSKPEEAAENNVVKKSHGKGSKPEEAAENNNVVKKSQGPGPHGKKDTAAYNDVIEETASKLREQRKNKVKALVGAFETVISLESETTPE